MEAVQERLICEWHDTNELVECILAACHIPVFIDGRFSCKYKDDYVYDIGLGAQYQYFNPNPDAPFMFIGPRSQIRGFPLIYQTIFKQPEYMKYLYETGYKDAQRCDPLLRGFFDKGYDLFLGENDVHDDRYDNRLRERWHVSPLLPIVEKMSKEQN